MGHPGGRARVRGILEAAEQTPTCVPHCPPPSSTPPPFPALCAAEPDLSGGEVRITGSGLHGLLSEAHGAAWGCMLSPVHISRAARARHEGTIESLTYKCISVTSIMTLPDELSCVRWVPTENMRWTHLDILLHAIPDTHMQAATHAHATGGRLADAWPYIYCSASWPYICMALDRVSPRSAGHHSSSHSHTPNHIHIQVWKVNTGRQVRVRPCEGT